ncbi:hypothetical protein GCM10023081_17190 [Arthrobacter ginkgonis]|uniref:C-type lysozyme inhibitor domain-containing protein n=1 Tax=Arthrobacter ginkgonis TaxID=1630594 RepID=A0ABP7C795_9MICC
MTELSVGARPHIEQRLDQTLGLCLLLAAATTLGGMFGLLLVWGGRVMPAWAISTTLLVASLALAIARARVRRHQAPDAGEQGPVRRRSGPWVALAVATGICSAAGGMGDFVFDAKYTVLQPGGPGFCQAAVKETSFLFAGSGELYAVEFGGLGRAVSSWAADDGYEPVASGSYDFEWTDEGALLSLYGGADPVWPGSHSFDCR